MVEKNGFGFYSVINKPSQEELNEYYSKKYYQDNKSIYAQHYSDEELNYIKNKIAQRYLKIDELKCRKNVSSKFLDVGCGEGFSLSYFYEKGWDVKGLDFSSFGCKTHNPDMVNFIEEGDIYEKLNKIIESKFKYDCIWLDNVLEHVLDPELLLKNLKKISNENTILVVEVPNDFSIFQMKLLEQKKIDKKYWIAIPDHISYFNLVGLNNLCAHCGWDVVTELADFPIDFNLANNNANYIRDKSNGSEAHQQRIFIDNLMHEISPELTNEYYNVLAKMGLGRQITAFLKLDK